MYSKSHLFEQSLQVGFTLGKFLVSVNTCPMIPYSNYRDAYLIIF